MLYFDYNATTPLSSASREAWIQASEQFPGNPSSPHRLGARASKALEEAREKLAARLGCEPHEIVWTSGATESSNTAVRHFGATSDGEAWVSAIEHPCVLTAVRREFKGRHRLIPVSADGTIGLDWLQGALAKTRPAFIGLMAANNETGVLQPWREVLTLCREHEVPLFCDAAQWIGKLPADGLGACDFVSGCAHKFTGPRGVGFLKTSAELRPLLVGGPQEDGRRAGTENVAGVLAMVAALESKEQGIRDEGPHLESLKSGFERNLKRVLPGVQIVGARVPRLWNTTLAVMPELANCQQRWVVKLDKLGFAVSTGSACASGKEEPSHVLASMGYAPAQAGRALRFSAGWETEARDWTELLAGLEQAWRQLAEA
ncbi:MAG: cysteine desulfurase [Verrucomicrobiota bacterium]|nr:cysteine desulfurase [Verrucomicrobiota bacterium]